MGVRLGKLWFWGSAGQTNEPADIVQLADPNTGVPVTPLGSGGSVVVGGNVASGATDSGNPVKVGGVYNSAAPTLTNGQRGDLQLDASGNQKVIGQAGEAHIGAVGGHILTPSANFTRPANTTAYASGQLVANSTTAGSVVPMTLTVARVAAGSFMLRRIRLRKSGTSITNAQFRVHFYSTTTITCANGDGGAWSTNQVANYLGAFDVTMDKAFTDGAAGNGTPVVGSEISHALASGTDVGALVEARAAYTPANAEVFTLIPEDLAN